MINNSVCAKVHSRRKQIVGRFGTDGKDQRRENAKSEAAWRAEKALSMPLNTQVVFVSTILTQWVKQACKFCRWVCTVLI
jgi:hypothetical protein